MSETKDEFSENVIALKRMNTSWYQIDIANFIQESDNPPNLSRKSLVKKIERQLERGTVEDRQRT